MAIESRPEGGPKRGRGSGNPAEVPPVRVEQSPIDRDAAQAAAERLRRSAEAGRAAGHESSSHHGKTTLVDVLKEAKPRPKTVAGKALTYYGGGLAGGALGGAAVGLLGFTGGWELMGGVLGGLGAAELVFFFPSILGAITKWMREGKFDLGVGGGKSGGGGGGGAAH